MKPYIIILFGIVWPWHYTIVTGLYPSHHGRIFSFSSIKPHPGAHGFDPALRDMHASFYCWGAGI
ncbi:MAG: alkaline phosphatase family protein [Ferruginibacter sp.]